MRVSSVSYGFTKNLGNYQSQRVDATVELQETDSFDDALGLAVAVVQEALDFPLSREAKEFLGDERERQRVAVSEDS